MDVHSQRSSHPSGQDRRQTAGSGSLTGIRHRNSEREYLATGTTVALSSPLLLVLSDFRHPASGTLTSMGKPSFYAGGGYRIGHRSEGQEQLGLAKPVQAITEIAFAWTPEEGIFCWLLYCPRAEWVSTDRKSTRLNSS